MKVSLSVYFSYLVLNPSMMIHPALLEWLYDEKPFPIKTWQYPLISSKSKFFNSVKKVFLLFSCLSRENGMWCLALTLQAFPGIATSDFVNVVYKLTKLMIFWNYRLISHETKICCFPSETIIRLVCFHRFTNFYLILLFICFSDSKRTWILWRFWR